RDVWRGLAARGIPCVVGVGIADVQGFLYGGKRNLSRVFDLLGIVCHVSPTPLDLTHVPPVSSARTPLASSKPAPSPVRRRSATRGARLAEISWGILLAAGCK